MSDSALRLHMIIPFPNEREAEIAYQVLSVDKEPPRSQTSKSLNTEKKNLKVCFSASNLQQLRMGVNGFLDHLILVCDTLVCFGPPVSSSYSHFV